MSDVGHHLRRPLPQTDEDFASLDAIETVETVGYVYVAPIIIAAGIVGSMANLIVLSHRNFKGRFNVYLKVRDV